MPRDEEQTCGNYDCETCYPGGVIFLRPTPEEFTVSMSKNHEM